MFIKLCKQYANMTEEDRRALVLRNGAIIAPALADMGNGVRDFLIFFLAVCGEGGEVSAEEYAVLSDAVSGLPENAEAVGREGERTLEDAVEALSLLGDEEKSALVSLCLCFCAVNGKIGKRAKHTLKSLVG